MSTQPFAASTLLAAMVALFGSAGGALAQFNSTPTVPVNEQTNSMGVLRIDTISSTLSAHQLSDLFDQGTALYSYPGWSNSRYITSPLLYDSQTCIAVGAETIKPINLNSGAAGFPQTVGQNSGTITVPLGTVTLTSDIINSYANYVAFPASGDFSTIYATQGSGPDEVLTEIQAFNLSSSGTCPAFCGGTTPCVNSNGFGFPTGADMDMVKAGYDNLYNGGASFASFVASGGGNSYGMVDSISAIPGTVGGSASDFPANSFFTIFPEITLPPILGTMSMNAIPLVGPGTAKGGAVLTTAGIPLVIEAQIPAMLGQTLPPSVVYIHQTNDFGVDLVFRDTCPNLDPNSTPPNQPYWQAGDILGTLSLAGHNPGVVNPCGQDAVSDFLMAVFGQKGQLNAGAVVGTIYGNNNFPPSASSTFASAPGTNFDGSSLDVVQFTNGASTLFVRNMSFSGFVNTTNLPAYGSSLIYTNPNTALSMLLSSDYTNFITGIATGQVQILLVNTNPPTSSTKVYYHVQLLSFKGSGSSSAGSFKVQQSPTKISPGLWIVQSNDVNNFKIGGNIIASFEWSFNGGATYQPAIRPIELNHQVTINCGTVAEILNFVKLSATEGELTWNGNYRLQSTPSLSTKPIVWSDVATVSPYIFSFASPTKLFYRLICP